MSLEIKVPAVGESITEVTISQWLKQDGALVEMDEVICELESEKATFELTAEAAGKLHIKAKEGETVEVGALVCEIDTSAAIPEKNAPKSEPKQQDTPADTPPSSTGEVLEMKVPTVGESITEVTISNWIKSDGDVVALDEPIAEIESDKATFELTAETGGKLSIVANWLNRLSRFEDFVFRSDKAVEKLKSLKEIPLPILL